MYHDQDDIGCFLRSGYFLVLHRAQARWGVGSCGVRPAKAGESRLDDSRTGGATPRSAMRILIAGANRAVLGGQEAYQRSIIPALGRAGHEVAYLHERTAGKGEPTVDGGAQGLPRWCIDEGGFAKALQQVAAWRPDVVYVNGLDSPLLEAALLKQIPAVQFAHGYYGTCPAGFKRHAFPEIAMCSRTIGATIVESDIYLSWIIRIIHIPCLEWNSLQERTRSRIIRMCSYTSTSGTAAYSA